MPNCLVDNEAIRCKLKEISIGQMQVAFRRQPNLVFEARYERLKDSGVVAKERSDLSQGAASSTAATRP